MRATTRLLTFCGALMSVVFLVLPTAPASARPLVDPGEPQVIYTAGTVSAPSTPASVTVRNGDSLSSIAEVLGVSWMQLAGFNRVADPNLILPGLVLRVPPAGYMPPPAAIPAPPPRIVTAAAASPATVPAPAPASTVTAGGVWGCIAEHESGNTNANTGNGYYGYFQFDPNTWAKVTGLPGLPSSYSYGTQLAAAEKLQAEAGWGQWPVTSRECGV